jgi:adenosylcobinamide-phosphate synthase
MAGALGVQLGGRNYYDGEPLDGPILGDPLVPLAARHIPQANAVMFATMGFLLALALVARVFVLHLWSLWRAAP